MSARGRAYHHHESEAQGAGRRRVRRNCALHKGRGRVRQAGNGCVRAALPHAAQQGRAGVPTRRSLLSRQVRPQLTASAGYANTCTSSAPLRLRCTGTVCQTHSFICSRAMHCWMPAMDSAKQYLWFSMTIFSNYAEVEHTAAADFAISNAQNAAHAHAVPSPFEHTTRALLCRYYWQARELGRGVIIITPRS